MARRPGPEWCDGGPRGLREAVARYLATATPTGLRDFLVRRYGDVANLRAEISAAADHLLECQAEIEVARLLLDPPCRAAVPRLLGTVSASWGPRALAAAERERRRLSR